MSLKLYDEFNKLPSERRYYFDEIDNIIAKADEAVSIFLKENMIKVVGNGVSRDICWYRYVKNLNDFTTLEEAKRLEKEYNNNIQRNKIKRLEEEIERLKNEMACKDKKCNRG